MIPIYCTIMINHIILAVLVTVMIASLPFTSSAFMAAAQTSPNQTSLTNVTQGPTEQEPQGLAGVNVTEGPPGPPGPQGEPGQGVNLTSLRLATTVVEGNLIEIPGPLQFEVVESTAACSPDTSLVGGGYTISEGLGLVLESLPEGNAWSVKAANPFPITAGTGSGSLQAHALCGSVYVSINASSLE